MPRGLQRKFRGVINKINKGKSVIWKAYTNQFIRNWKINYEFVYKAYFMKIAALMKARTET